MSLSLAAGVICDICGAEENTPVFTRPDTMQVVQCAECELMYLNPRPASDVVQSWYGLEYFSQTTNPYRGYSDYLSQDSLRSLVRDAERKIGIVARHCALSDADVLEMGCATGETCYVVSQTGARVAGCDLSAEAIRLARSRYPRLDFRVGSAEEIPFPDHSFDVILAFELIEHLSSPTKFISQVRRLIKPGGILVLTTPNADCGKRVGWHRWTGFLTSFEHLYFFSPRSLNRILSQQGLSILCSYSRGSGRVRPSSVRRLQSILRRLGLFRITKAVHRTVASAGSEVWTSCEAYHTLLIVAGRDAA